MKNLILLLFMIFLVSIQLHAFEKFYNYYEKGLSYMQKRDYPRAIEEFKSASSLEFKDVKRKRTYGTRFIEYFPHREMGIAYYKLGEAGNAKKELEISIAFKKSKKAKKYLTMINEGKSHSIAMSKSEEKPQEIKLPDKIKQKKKPASTKKKSNKKHKKTKKSSKKTYYYSQNKVPTGALTYDPSRVTQVGSRLSVAVLPFDNKEEELGMAVTDKMITQLVNLRRFRVIDRNSLESVMKEQSLGLSGMVDEQTAVKVGKLVGADVIIIGNVITQPKFAKVSARVIDIETSETIVAKDAQTTYPTLKNIEKLVEDVAIMIYNDLPLVEGNIIKVEDNTIYIDLGTTEGLRRGTKCVAFEEGEEIINPVTKEILGKKVKKLGEIIVEQVQNKMSIAKIISKEGSIKTGDKIVVK